MTKKAGKNTAKRGNGRGSVRQLPSGRWQWRASIELPSGEVQRVAGTVTTKTEAEAALSRVRTDAERGQFSVTPQTTLGEYLLTWFAKRAPGIAASYARNQKSIIDNHILPKLGKRRLGSITPRELETFYAGLTYQAKQRPDTKDRPVGDSLRKQVHGLLAMALSEAVRYGELTYNPTSVAHPHYTREAAQETTIKAWTSEQAYMLYTTARADRVGSIFAFMLATGVRIGEALGLRWENVDLETGRVRIQEALICISGKPLRTTPKTARSRRTITVSGDVLEILREWRARPLLDQEAQGDRYVGSDSVFTSTVGLPLIRDALYRPLKRLCKEAGVPYMGAHACRHTFISIQGASGKPIEVISAHVGHAKASFTLDHYRTVFEKERENLVLDFSSLMPHSAKA